MADIKLNDLPTAVSMDDAAVLPFSQEQAGTPTSFKMPITDIGAKIAEDLTFSNLQTAHKTLVEAINDAATGSGGTAQGVTYDNTDSGLAAENVQDAIDEINANCNNSLRCAYTSQSNLTQYDVDYDNLVAVSGRTFGMALVFAWKDIFALFYASDSSIFIKPLTPSPNRTATVNWNSTTRNIEITFDQQVWLGISVYPV